MPGTVLILGAKGRFGRAAVQAFGEAGWTVRRFARHWDAPGAGDIAGDAFDAGAVTQAARGSDVIVNALNPPYPAWARDLPRLTRAVIAAARESGARVMIPGNVYNYGAGMPPVLSSDTPFVPTTRKGRLRVEMEAEYAASGIPTIILRGGDFIEGKATGNWFESHITPKLDKGIVVYPGPLDRDHAWAYLPDMARAMAGLAAIRADLPGFLSLGFPGYTLTGAELIGALEEVTGRSLRVRKMPWGIVRLLALFRPLPREVLEIRYLWDVPHAIDGGEFARVLPGFVPTELHTALGASLAARGLSAPSCSPEDI